MSADGVPVDRANVFAEISSRDTLLPLRRAGNGLYIGAYLPDGSGSYVATIYASVAYFASNQTTASFAVSNLSASFADEIQRFADGMVSDMDNMLEIARRVAEDGDWFYSQVSGDFVNLGFIVVAGIFGFGKGFSRVYHSVAVDGMIRDYTPGLDSWRLIKSEVGLDGRVFESWATHISHAARESLLGPRYSNTLFPKYLTASVVQQAAVAFGYKYVKTL